MRARSSSPSHVTVPSIVIEGLQDYSASPSPASPFSPTCSPSLSPALTPTYRSSGLCSSTSSASSLPVLRREDETDELSEPMYSYPPESFALGGAFLTSSGEHGLAYVDAMATEDTYEVYAASYYESAYSMELDAAYVEDPALMHAFLDTL